MVIKIILCVIAGIIVGVVGVIILLSLMAIDAFNK